MKQLLFILSVAIALTACKKENAAATRSQLAGQWEFIRFSGYGIFAPPLPPGNGKIIVFGSSGNFERRQHDTLLYKGKYQLDIRKDCIGEEKKPFLITSDSTFVKDFYIRIEDSLLFISSPNCYQDGGSSIYRKL